MTLGPVALPGETGAFELELEGGRVAAVRPVDARPERLALPAFADLHVHADRSYAGGDRTGTSLADAIELSMQLRRDATEEDIRARATRLLRNASRNGSTRVRTHCDVDVLAGDAPLAVTTALREELRGVLDLEIVAFATSRLDPASEEGRRRLVSAVERGADLIGASAWFHPDPQRSIEATLELARELGVPADFHLDESTDPSTFMLDRLAEATIAYGLEGRVYAGHCCVLACVEPEVAAATVERVAAAGITVISLPATNLYLQDRREGTPRLRGITLVHELLAAGVPVRFGSDNVGDVFYPYGDADPLEAAFLAALGVQLDDEDALLAGICGGRTRVREGDPADLVVLEAASLREAIARRPHPRTVLRAGEPVSPAA